MTPLLTRGGWGIYSDGAAIWLCDDALSSGTHYCGGRYCHTAPRSHRGPLHRVRPFYAPWQTEQWCVRWAVAELGRRSLIPTALEAMKQELADAAEVERILETL